MRLFGPEEPEGFMSREFSITPLASALRQDSRVSAHLVQSPSRDYISTAIMALNHRLLSNLAYPGAISPYQCFDVYIPLAAPPKLHQLIFFVHGGAWRSGDKADTSSSGLIKNLSNDFPTAAICSVNYRLSGGKLNPKSNIKHPTHNADVARAIDQATSLPELKEVDQTYLIGHSVGAFMCLSLAGIMVPPPGAPRLTTSTSAKIHGLVLVDGIYDIVKMLEEYPSYKDFVASAFGGKDDSDRLKLLEEANPLSWPASSNNVEQHPRILIIHSRQDTLLSIHQSELATTALKSKLSFGDKVVSDFDSVSGDHEELLLSPQLASRIKSFISESK
ncbi:hypothetical protein H4Q26_007321 [Puccinia striiformis f. sp. tritici PST-130]|nr:hypothetical protein H4Q26_007321 [Puccinia striiformis f. sp. tritici PST-130]